RQAPLRSLHDALPIYDVAVAVLDARVGGIGLGAAAVVGQRQVHIAVQGVHRGPFRAVHGRGAQGVGSAAGVEQDGGQIAVQVAQGVTVAREGGGGPRVPATAAIVVGARRVEGARIRVVGVDRETLEGMLVRRVPERGGNELVQVFVLRIVAAVEHHRLAGFGQARPAAFMPEAAQGGALHCAASRVVRIDLDDIAVGARLVAVVLQRAGATGRDVEAGELVVDLAGVSGGGLPAVAGGLGGDADATLVVRQAGAAVDEHVGPVFLAGQVGAPGRVAVAAVVVGAACAGAIGREAGLHMGRAAQRTGQLHHAGGGEAAVERVIVDHPPAAVLLADAQHAHAVGIDLLAHLLGGAPAIGVARRAVGVKGLLIDVLVVHHQQTVLGTAVEGEEMHAVVVHAHRIGLILGAVAAVRLPGTRRAVQWRAPGRQHLGAVAGRYHARVGA